MLSVHTYIYVNLSDLHAPWGKQIRNRVTSTGSSSSLGRCCCRSRLGAAPEGALSQQWQRVPWFLNVIAITQKNYFYIGLIFGKFSYNSNCIFLLHEFDSVYFLKTVSSFACVLRSCSFCCCESSKTGLSRGSGLSCQRRNNQRKQQ